MVNSTASSELQVELLPRLSRNLSHCCEKGLSAPGVGFFHQHQQNQALAYVKFLVR